MTFYDKLEDARQRRQALLAERAPVPAANVDAPTVSPIGPAKPTDFQPLPKPAVADRVDAPPSPPIAKTTPEMPNLIPAKAKAPASGERRRRSGPLMWLVAFLVVGLGLAAGLAPWDNGFRVASNPQTATDTTTVDAPTQFPAARDPAPAALSSLDATAIPVAPRPTRVSAPGTVIMSLPNTRTAPTALSAPARDTLPALDEASDIPAGDREPLTSIPRPPGRPASALSTPQATPVARDGGLTIVMHIPNRTDDTVARTMVEVAANAGFNIDRTLPAPFSVSQTNVRYFHVEDADAATALASGINGVARDFTSFRPTPPTGIVEVWVAGRGIGAPTAENRSGFQRLQDDLKEIEASIRRALGG